MRALAPSTSDGYPPPPGSVRCVSAKPARWRSALGSSGRMPPAACGRARASRPSAARTRGPVRPARHDHEPRRRPRREQPACLREHVRARVLVEQLQQVHARHDVRPTVGTAGRGGRRPSTTDQPSGSAPTCASMPGERSTPSASDGPSARWRAAGARARCPSRDRRAARPHAAARPQGRVDGRGLQLLLRAVAFGVPVPRGAPRRDRIGASSARALADGALSAAAAAVIVSRSACVSAMLCMRSSELRTRRETCIWLTPKTAPISACVMSSK